MESPPYPVGPWLPSNQTTTDNWVAKLIKEVDGTTEDIVEIDVGGEDEVDLGQETQDLLPPVQDLKELIERDSEINKFFRQMFSQIPRLAQFNDDPSGNPQVRNYQVMLRVINAIITRAPEFNETIMVGIPLTAILSRPMGTAGGFSAFLSKIVNFHLKNILNCWAIFLKSEDSRYVLNKDPRKGWFGEDAMKAMPNFLEEYKCDPTKEYFGFSSWDDFFTREFRPGVRPVASPDDNRVIVNACESAPYNVAFNVQHHSRFWIKSQPYSIIHMLANDPLAESFVGGTVYQAYLSIYSYHHWHSPVDGTIVKAYTVEGSYFAAAKSVGFDFTAQNQSQAFVTEVATRTLMFIEADNNCYIGLMCFMAVGMMEISSCDITVSEGQRVKKGQQLGMFHYGGSTHCLIFRPGVEVEFDLHGETPSLDANTIPINSRIATVPK